MSIDWSALQNLDMNQIGMGVQVGGLPTPGAYANPDGSLITLDQMDAAAAGGGGSTSTSSGSGGTTSSSNSDDVERINRQLQAMEGFFQSNGLMSLWGGVRGYVEQGYSDIDTILGILSRDNNYQQAYYSRFPAVKIIRDQNAERAANGMPPRAEPSPAAYIALEAGYRQALVGLPDGLWGTSQDVSNWIAGEVSVQEVADRVTVAKNFVYYDTNQYVKSEIRSLYGMTDEEMVAYVLDPERALPQIQNEYERRLSQAYVGGGARSQGVGLTDLLRDEIAGTQFGTSFDMASQTFKGVANESIAYERLGALSRKEVTQADLVKEAFGLTGGTDTTTMKKRLASEERARFSGQSGISRTSLTQQQSR